MASHFGEDNVPEATVSFGRGNSAEPTSPHFADQDEPWANVEYKKLAFRRTEVDARETARVVLAGKK